VGTGATCRPWLQDFTMRGVKYEVEEVKAQIKAAEEQGYEEWLLWDPSLNYSVGALRSEGS
jgi:Putative glycosyl hydrolase domain